MTKGTRNIIFILVPIILLVVLGVRYLGDLFSNRYLPPSITVTQNQISSSGGFVNAITIEKLKVDSFGMEKRPTKYVIEYLTTCTIKQNEGEPTAAVNEIKLNESGRYSWSDEIVHIPIIHPEGVSKRIDSANRPILSEGNQQFSVCPLRFEKENWYFINFQDPIFIGVYIYLDKTGAIHQYAAFSKSLPVP